MQNQMNWTMTAFLVSSFSTILFSSESEGADRKPSSVSAGPHHPACEEAFGNLPINDRGEPVEFTKNVQTQIDEELDNLPEHYTKHSVQYRRYDDACFFGWADLKLRTKQFLENNAGVLFEDTPEGLRPKCSAFRISHQFIVSASHCIGIFPLQFRLFGAPDVPISVKFPNTENLGKGGEDIYDYAIFEIGDSPLAYSWTKKDFKRDFKPHQSIIIAAVSLPVFYIKLSGQVDNWLHAVRFSRVYASQIWPTEEMVPAPATDLLRRECVFHKAPTFPGMSGAAIVGVTRPQPPADLPEFSVMGIHIRNGPRNGDDADTASSNKKTPCGNYPRYNVGIRIPLRIIDIVSQ